MDVLNSNPEARPQYRIVLTPQNLALPVDLASFTRNNFSRVELEIGFGNGEFTVKNAQLHPDTLFWGIDVSAACVLRCARRAAGLENLRIIRTDARYMMRKIFGDNSLDAVRMNFPCPWPKRKQAHRRVTARSFTDDLAAVLKPDGIFEMVTDDPDYAQEVHRTLGAHPSLEVLTFETNPNRPITTKYERKWLAMGKSIFRLTFAKKTATCGTSATANNFPEDIMHFKTTTPPSVEQIMTLNGVTGSAGDKTHWSFGHCAVALIAIDSAPLKPCPAVGTDSQNDHEAVSLDTPRAFLLETFSSDDEFDQRYYIRISERNGGSLIQLDKTANAFLTPAVRASLADVATRLSPESSKPYECDTDANS